MVQQGATENPELGVVTGAVERYRRAMVSAPDERLERIAAYDGITQVGLAIVRELMEVKALLKTRNSDF